MPVLKGLGAALVAALSASILMLQSAAADEPPRPGGPTVSRYAQTQAYVRGGQADRDGLVAETSPIPGAAPDAVELTTGPGGEVTGVHIRLEVAEIQEEVYPGEFVTFWVFAPVGSAMSTAARLPSPTIRVQSGDQVKITLYNTHYLPHTIHLHGLNQAAGMDGVPDVSQKAIAPGSSFTYEFTAKTPGTYYYHCHVQEPVHVQMGLAGMLVVEPRRPGNHFARLVPGAGRIATPSLGVRETHDREYSLVFMDVDHRLNRIPAMLSDVREIERRMHRDYDTTQRKPDIFLLNGRSYPFTLRDSPITVASDERVKLRILNVGGEDVALHTHGHHPTLTAMDGYDVPVLARIIRDTFDIAPSQRIDLDLKTGSDGYFAAGPGQWMVHNHAPEAATNRGINPGGGHTMIVYEDAPKMAMGDGAHMGHSRETLPGYYQGKVPVFEGPAFNGPAAPSALPSGVTLDYPSQDRAEAPPPRLDLIDLERHRVIGTACPRRPEGRRRVVIRAGAALAGPGQAYGFSPNRIELGRCEEVEVVMENLDQVRHDLMIPGMDPMLTVNFIGPGTQSAVFVTPDKDITLPFHCHVAAHDKVGMTGVFVIGRGGPASAPAVQPSPSAPSAPERHIGKGVITGVIPRTGKVLIDHEAIPGFMAAMEMAYPVSDPALLQGLKEGDKVEFTIDATQAAIVAMRPAKD
jgi:manganese oxidase